MDTCDADSCRHPYEGLSEVPQLFKRMRENYFRKEVFDPTELEEKLGARKATTAAYFMICFLCTFLVLCFIGTSLTAYERYCTKHTKKNSLEFMKKKSQTKDFVKNKQKSLLNGVQKSDWLTKCKCFCNCFCLITNGKELFNTTPANGDIPCLHGIRVISQIIIILCHIFTILLLTIISNFKEYINIMETWGLHMAIISVFHAVDAFFLLSGLLNAYSYFQSEVKRKSWFYFYVHRYIRLSPMYFIILSFWTTIFPYLGSSKCWSTYPGNQICSEYWWRNFFYTSNMYPLKEMCMVWSWSLCCDMQFFMISPLFLVTLRRWPKVTFSVIGLFICGSALTNFLLTYTYNLPFLFLDLYDYLKQRTLLEGYIERVYNYLDKLYMLPYSRISPYVIGVVTAYHLINWHQRKQKKISRVAIKQGWTAATILILYVIFGISRNGTSLIETSLYSAINQICFAGAIAWIIYTCVTGQGGIINTVLSSKIWIPLSRLSYSAYLIHPVLALMYSTLLKEPVELSYIAMGTIDCSLAAGSFIMAFFVHLLFECPFARIEKLFWNKFNVI